MNNFTLRLNENESGFIGLELHWDAEESAYVGFLHPADGSEAIPVIVQPVLG